MVYLPPASAYNDRILKHTFNMKKCAFIMDPLDSINTKKDSTFAMMLEAQKRKHEINGKNNSPSVNNSSLPKTFDKIFVDHIVQMSPI